MPYANLGNKSFRGLRDSDGLRWIVDDIEGWDSPDVELTRQELSGDDGDTVDRARFTGRALLVRGSILGEDVQSPWTARTRLGGLANMVRTPGILVVFEDDPEVDKQCTVHLEGRIRSKISGKRHLDFEIPLLAPDPRKYAVVESQSGVLLNGYTTNWAVNNRGTMRTHWRAVISGAGGIRLKRGTGASDPYLWIEENVGASSTLVIDSADRTITIDGVNAYDALNLGVSEWWMLEPGSQTIRLTADWVAANARADIFYTSAWV